MGTQKQSGKAFEFAVLQALATSLGASNCQVVQSNAINVASTDFQSLSQDKQDENVLAGIAAANLLLNFEPHLVLVSQGKYQLDLSLQSDQAGATGDVRDILLAIPQLNWEVGISAKHQHEALKHSRLSNQIDFGDKWYGVPSSSDYFDDIRPVFDQLRQLKTQGLAWSQLVNKESDVYKPVLLAFQKEVQRMETNHKGVVARGLVAYLIGHKDFYKVIKLKRQTKVQVFNFNGTLNMPMQSLQPDIRLEKLKLPTRVVELDFRRGDQTTSNTTLDMICDAGWQLSFRLHNASTRVEPSLKFDINLVGRPNNLQTFSAVW